MKNAWLQATGCVRSLDFVPGVALWECQTDGRTPCGLRDSGAAG